MSKFFSPLSPPPPQRQVAESSLEFLLGELMQIESTSALDNIGYDVGYRCVERVLSRQKTTLSANAEPLDLVKMVCKDFWEEVFQKKIDKLQTNHRGVFVLSDYKFKWLDKYVSDDAASKQAAAKMLHFPCGIIRGALANLGLSATVHADFTALPGCTFNIRIKL